MKKHIVLAAILGLGCGGATHNMAGGPDPDQTRSIEEYAREIFAHFDAGDVEFVKQSACHEAVMWDIDEHGNPVVARGKEAVGQALDGFKAAMDSGLSIQSTLSDLFCRAGGNQGFCTIEFDQTFSMNGQPQGTMKYRGSMFAHYHHNKWIWTHWHASLREAPAAADAAATEAPAAEAPAAE